MVRAQASGTLPASPPGTGVSAVWTTIRNSSGRSTATVSAAGRSATGSSNRTVTLAAGCPADKRRLLAIDGGGGCISTCRAAGLPTAPTAARSPPAGDRARGVRRQVGHDVGGGLIACGPDRVHDPHLLGRVDAQRPADVLGRPA